MKNPLLFAAFLCGCIMAFPSVATAAKDPGFKFNGGKLRVDPTVNVGIYWESNLNNTVKDEESGFGWRIQPALSISYNTKRTTIGSNLFYSLHRTIDNNKDGDSDSYGISFSVLHKLSERTRLTMSGSYSRSETDDFYWNGNPDSPAHLDKDRTDNYNFNAALGYTAKHWHASLGAGWHRSEQLDDDNRGKQTSDSISFHAMWGKAIGAHTFWDFSFGMTLDRPDDGDDSTSYSLMTGVSGEVSERTAYSAMVGVMMYDYSGFKDDTACNPTYNISCSYRLSRKVALSLSAGSSYQSEYYGGGAAKHYYVVSHTVTAAANVQWTDVLSSRFDVRANLEQHEKVSGDRSDVDRLYWQICASTYYKFNNYISMYGSLSYSMDEADGSGYDEDKDNLRAELGLSFRF